MLQALAEASVIPDELASEAAESAQIWEEDVLPFFEVNIPAPQVATLLESYSTNISIPVPRNASNSSISYYALALNDDGTPVPVVHSDIGFNLLYGNNLPEELVATVPLLLSEFPRGLMTGVGMVVANPAYSGGGEFFANFTTGDYHGTVVWSFQQALMAAGEQLAHLSDKGTSCRHFKFDS